MRKFKQECEDWRLSGGIVTTKFCEFLCGWERSGWLTSYDECRKQIKTFYVTVFERHFRAAWTLFQVTQRFFKLTTFITIALIGNKESTCRQRTICLTTMHRQVARTPHAVISVTCWLKAFHLKTKQPTLTSDGWIAIFPSRRASMLQICNECHNSLNSYWLTYELNGYSLCSRFETFQI